MNEGLKLAFHPNRGVRMMARLKPGWRWVEAHEKPAELTGTKLQKPGLVRGRVGSLRIRRKGEF